MTTEISSVRLQAANGIELAADIGGDPTATPVLLFHGGGQTRHSWGSALHDLVERGHHVASIDLRGHGDSDWSPTGDYSGDVFPDDVIAVARQFDRPVLVGASLGGIASLAAVAKTADDPVGRALVLVDVAPNLEPDGVSRIREFMQRDIETGFASLDDVADAIQSYNPHRPRPSNLEGLKKNVRLRDGRWYWHWDPAFMSGKHATSDETRIEEYNERAATLEAAARTVTVPTLLVRGRNSDLLSEEGAKRFLELVPHAEYADVEGAGHMVAGDRNDAFNDSVVEFLRRLPGPAH